MTTMVYLVGDKASTKTNSWLAMTNDPEEANRLLEEIDEAVVTKAVEVKPRRVKNTRKKTGDSNG